MSALPDELVDRILRRAYAGTEQQFIEKYGAEWYAAYKQQIDAPLRWLVESGSVQEAEK